MSEFTDKVLLVSLSIKRWGDARKDRDATEQTLLANGAGADSGRFVRCPVGKYLDGVKAAAGRMRHMHLHKTLPWADDTGQRIISAEAYPEYCEELRKLIEQYDDEVDRFLKNYETIKEARRMEDMGGLFREEDWPPVEIVRESFGAKVRTLPVTTASDFRVSLSQEVADEVKAEMQEAFDAQVKAANTAAFVRLHKTVSHMAEQVAAVQNSKEIGRKRPRLHDSLVNNVQEQCRELKKLNAWGNEDLDKMIREIEKKLAVTPAAVLRDSETARTKTQEDAGAIADRLRQLF